ncbi:type III secretion system YscQ/HrcQ family protein [Stenotrophomonas maltophilia]|uniref:FliM/FliN family flagellar motor switch protein n=1 Tax=Stenotrophomonas chelatiphaga TaxID=517011 RepID=UPI000F4B8E98|nr:FliM/FliN family flagellar motor switch protein [Stenotrophomonas chelatiphaga]MCS4230661.1 type III secretion system YscQ/HrcQ family protein [Stenotrophomonas chelatiphaga]ROQ40156.1 type III secretion system YscQ/HrcQ family protein [Stenotrophomonas maltophilia]
MSRQLALLARIDPQTLHVQELQQALRGGGVDAGISTPPPSPCLHFQLASDSGAMVCRVDANAWAAVHLPGLVGLDWASMDPLVRAGLTDVQHPLQFAHDALRYDRARLLPASAAASEARALPTVPAAEGTVWIESWTAPLPRATQAPRLPAGLPVPIGVQLGATALTLRQLRRLRGGDIVLISDPAARAWRGSRPLFDFHLETDSLLVTTVHSPAPAGLDTPRLPLSENAAMLDVPDLQDLPLELHVLLCRIDLSLGELAGLQQGSVLTLPEGAIERVQFLHNGRPLVSGELVQVGDRLGVKLAQAPRLT